MQSARFRFRFLALAAGPVIAPLQLLAGQWIQRSFDAHLAPVPARLTSEGPSPGRVGLVVLGAGAGGLVGAGVGLATAAVVLSLPECNASDCDSDLRGLAFVAVGGILGVPMGAHLANGRRGSFSRDLVATVACLGGAAILARGSGPGQLLVPLAPVVGAVVTELQSARQRSVR